MIEARALRKQYGDATAVDGIDLSVQPGECFGILGPNGAGKTTTIKMIHCVSPLTSGELRVFGLDVTRDSSAIKRRIGVCQQEDNLDPDFSVLKNLAVFSRYFGIPTGIARERGRELLEFMGLWERRDQNIRDLSGGLKRRLMIARALVNHPELLILDEPTTGLDPQSRHQVWEKVRTLKREGKTILLTTHYMDEAEKLCDRLVIMDRGKILVTGEPRELIHKHLSKEVVEIWEPTPKIARQVQESGWAHETDAERTFVYADRGEEILTSLAREHHLSRCTVRPANLEDLFLKLTGRELRE